MRNLSAASYAMHGLYSCMHEPQLALLQYSARRGAFLNAVFLMLLMGVSILRCEAMAHVCAPCLGAVSVHVCVHTQALFVHAI